MNLGYDSMYQKMMCIGARFTSKMMCIGARFTSKIILVQRSSSKMMCIGARFTSSCDRKSEPISVEEPVSPIGLWQRSAPRVKMQARVLHEKSFALPRMSFVNLWYNTMYQKTVRHQLAVDVSNFTKPTT